LKSSASGTTVEIIDKEEKVGYQQENWKAITSSRVREGQVGIVLELDMFFFFFSDCEMFLLLPCLHYLVTLLPLVACEVSLQQQVQARRRLLWTVHSFNCDHRLV
jgi:hypothetical protein